MKVIRFFLWTMVAFGSLAECEAVTARTLVSPSRQFGFRLSPEGEYVASMLRVPQGAALIITDVKTGRQIESIPIPFPSVTGLSWATGERIVLEAMGGLVAVNSDGSNKSILTGAGGGSRYTWHVLSPWKVLHSLPDDPDHILAAQFIDVGKVKAYKVNINAATKRMVVGDDLAADGWITDRNGRVRLGHRSEKDKFKLLYRKHERAPWKSFDAFVQGDGMQFDYGGGSYLNQRVFVLDFDFDPMIVYLASNLGRDTRQIVTYDLLTQRVGRSVLSDDTYDLGDDSLENTKLLFLDSEKKLVGIRYERDKPSIRWKDRRFRDYQRFLDDQLKGTFNEMVDWSRDGSVILVRAWSDLNWGDIYIFRPGSNKLVQIASLSPELKKARLSRTRPITIDARDGIKLHGYINFPPGKENQKNPFILYPHGGPWMRDSWNYDPFLQYMATRGFTVLRINFRGSAGYGREHILAGVGEVGGKMIDDMADAVNWAKNKGYVDGDKIGVMGASYGGYATFMCLIRYPELFKAGVALVAPVDLKRQVLYLRRNRHWFAYEFWRYAVGKGLSDAVNERISPFHLADRLRGKPLICFFGQEDPTVPVEQAEFLREAFDSAGLDYKLTIFPHEGHTFHDPKNMVTVLNAMGEHFEKHVKN